jgi:hypothetical protein
VLEDGSDDKANRYYWKGASSRAPLEVMLTSDNTTSSWSIEWDVDN